MLTSLIAGLEKTRIRTVFLWSLNDNDPAWFLYKPLDFFTTGQKQELKERALLGGRFRQGLYPRSPMRATAPPFREFSVW